MDVLKVQIKNFLKSHSPYFDSLHKSQTFSVTLKKILELYSGLYGRGFYTMIKTETKRNED